MPFGHGEVGGIRGRGDFHRAGTEFHGHVVIGDDGDAPVHQGEDHFLADDVLVADIIGMHGHGRVAQHGFWTGGRHDDLATAVGQGIADVPEGTGLLLVLHFQIGDGGMAAGAPVDDIIPLINQIFVIKADKDFPHGPRKALIHGKALPVPVAGAPQPF
ncbi:MAG: hypothetical protein A4E72_01611 [Syntrophus sp. PtaU1.Bin208]|nr:MAG: hypothetical protein A4E72_01611 [Syntrophus sp. PtaU1.Bin208]